VIGSAGFVRTPILSLLLVCHAGLAAGATLSGVVRLEGRGDASSRVADAVVTYAPDRLGARTAPEVPVEPFELVTEGKEFRPRVLVVPVGSKVRLPNRDPILHNVFSVSGDNAFDVGLYRRGEGEMVTFEHSGLVRVFCNVHHSMVAYVLVVDTPWVVRPDADGRFRLTGVPEGPGKLTIWHERADAAETQVTLPVEHELRIRLEVTKPLVPKHLNKVGKPYGRRYR
jgi:plastocyanin